MILEKELEVAGRSSYKYLMMAILSEDEEQESDPIALKEMREKVAVSMARRHLTASKGNSEKALKQMKGAIAFRTEMNMDGIRLCYNSDLMASKLFKDDDKIQKEWNALREGLDNQMKTPIWVVRSRDKNNRAPIFCEIRKKKDRIFHPVEYLRIHAYMLERSLACAERLSVDENVEHPIIIFTYWADFLLGDATPLSLCRKLLNMMSNCYPERLYKFYIIDAPYIFSAFWKLVKPFIDPVTKQKFIFIKGEEQRREEFSNILDPDQAVSFTLPEGKLPESFDVKKFMYDIPFDYCYDETY